MERLFAEISYMFIYVCEKWKYYFQKYNHLLFVQKLAPTHAWLSNHGQVLSHHLIFKQWKFSGYLGCLKKIHIIFINFNKFEKVY